MFIVGEVIFRALMLLGFIILLFGIAGLAIFFGQRKQRSTNEFEVEGSRLNDETAKYSLELWDREHPSTPVAANTGLPPVGNQGVPPELALLQQKQNEKPSPNPSPLTPTSYGQTPPLAPTVPQVQPVQPEPVQPAVQQNPPSSPPVQQTSASSPEPQLSYPLPQESLPPQPPQPTAREDNKTPFGTLPETFGKQDDDTEEDW